jgi:hypothetical protein
MDNLERVEYLFSLAKGKQWHSLEEPWMKLSTSTGPEITWQEAAARLARERTLAETCAALLKKHSDPAAIDRGALAYGEAKAEYDGIIAGLVVALARKGAPTSLPDLQDRLKHAVAKRDAFCRSVQSLAPAPVNGEKGVISEIVEGAIGGAIDPLVDAIKAIWMHSRDENALLRKTIETQLEATAWPNFASISPFS